MDGSLRDDKFGGGEKGERGSSRVMHGRASAVKGFYLKFVLKNIQSLWDWQKKHPHIIFNIHSLREFESNCIVTFQLFRNKYGNPDKYLIIRYLLY